MTYQGHSYNFELAFTEVAPNGDLRGTLSWPDYGLAPHGPIIGFADGKVLTFVDGDRDEKVVVLSGDELHGTDKNGAATFDATRVRVELPPSLDLGAKWSRQVAACDALRAEGPSLELLSGQCFFALARAAGDERPCAKTADAQGCRREVRVARGDASVCGFDVDCVLEAVSHGAPESVCERLQRYESARCFARARKVTDVCEGLEASMKAVCLTDAAVAKRDLKACEVLVDDVARVGCLRRVAVTARNRDWCGVIRERGDPTLVVQQFNGCVDELNHLERRRCQSESDKLTACTLQEVGNGAERWRCAELKTPTRGRCERMAAMPVATPLNY